MPDPIPEPPVRNRPPARGPIVLMTALATLGGTGCASAGFTSPEASPNAGGTTASIPASSSTLTNAEFEALYRARIEAARTRFSEADVRFMNDMIHHHAQALDMARLAPGNGASPSVQTLAARITNAQRDEIRTMQRWLEDRGLPAPEVHETANGVVVHDPGHGGHGAHGAQAHASMPGMLTPAQIEALGRARGPAFDRHFLELMIEHHRGAVVMVRELFATDGAARDEEVFRFASDVHVDQVTEVARMERMLEALPPVKPLS